jgi:hypothetical protein
MSRVAAAVLLALVAADVQAGPLPPQPPAKPPRAFELRDELRKPVDFNGFEDPKTTLAEALEMCAKRYNLSFDVNERAFKTESLQDVLKTEIANPNPVPPMPKTAMNLVLKRILERIPVPSGATFILRGPNIEITTVQAVRNEIWGEDYAGPFAPLVHVFADRKPLDEILKDLAQENDLNILVDPLTGEKGRAALSAQLLNAPLDTVLEALTAMANLKVVRMRNVYFVTTPEKAEVLEKAQKERAASMPPAKPTPGME